MAKDKLFLLSPHFIDPKAGFSRFYCPECAFVEGIIAYHPALRDLLEIQQLAFPRPRPVLIDLLGPDLQSCPVLVLAETSRTPFKIVEVSPTTGRRYVAGFKTIAEFLAAAYGIDHAHP